MEHNEIPPLFVTSVTTKVHMVLNDVEYDPYNFLIASAKAHHYIIDDDSGEPLNESCGSADLYMIDAGEAINLEVDIFDVCDADSQELLDVAEAIFNEKIAEKLGAPINTCLYVSEIDPGPIPLGIAVYSLDRCFGGGADVITVAHDMSEFGFTRIAMPHWREGIDLWVIHTAMKTPDFPSSRPPARVIRPPKKLWKKRKGRGTKA